MKNLFVNSALGFALLCLFSINTFANYCACCSEKGYYSISYSKPDSYQLDLLKSIKFAPTATLYQDEGGDDSIKGISNIAEKYDFIGSFLNPKWNFTFKTGGKSGVLKLPMPLKMINYKVDIHSDDNEESHGDPVLYKEFRFEGMTSGTGIFQNGIDPLTKYFLVLQGRGNLCDNPEDFTHWRLEITGKKAKYAFYGKLKTD